jgi:5-(aminomethyl)-3-furanmethanol phosphate kinase
MNNEPRIADTVVKLGGGVFPDRALLDAVVEVIVESAREVALLVVPGGGAFADAVRGIDSQVGLSDDAAHWMAVLAMDQSAWLIADRAERAQVVTAPAQIAPVTDAGRVPVLAPFDWLRRADPLPHTWDVTSDSISAWVAAALGARSLVLIKPPGAEPGWGSVDPYFGRAVGEGILWRAVPADRLELSCLRPDRPRR